MKLYPATHCWQFADDRRRLRRAGGNGVCVDRGRLADDLRSARVRCSSAAARKIDWGQTVMFLKLECLTLEPQIVLQDDPASTQETCRRTQKGGSFVSEAISAATHYELWTSASQK